MTMDPATDTFDQPFYDGLQPPRRPVRHPDPRGPLHDFYDHHAPEPNGPDDVEQRMP